jgi:hypothetical protein
MPSEAPPKTLEMRVAELEDKLARLEATSQAGAAPYVPPCVVHYIPPCTQHLPYVPPCTHQAPAQYAAIPPCAMYVPPCVYHPAQMYPAQAPANLVAVPPCSGAGKKTDQSGAAKDPSCEDFGGLGT